jgi:16S rRNA (cytidine1402-2'-O)-methyltransferase
VLYVVATPIGNLEDITLRALRILSEVDVVLAEDTRRTRTLLSRHSISRPHNSVISYHEHNETKRQAQVLDELKSGRDVALVTDAGTPGVSDPGYRIVRAAQEAGFDVRVVPGACAAVAAISGSGLPTDTFTFVGFPPKKKSQRRRWLDQVATSSHTLILYAAGRDVASLLREIARVRSDPTVVLGRELTKVYEQWIRGKASEVADTWEADPKKGEVTIVVDRAEKLGFDDAALTELLRHATVAEVAADTGVSKRRIYQLHLRLKEMDDS